MADDDAARYLEPKRIGNRWPMKAVRPALVPLLCIHEDWMYPCRHYRRLASRPFRGTSQSRATWSCKGRVMPVSEIPESHSHQRPDYYRGNLIPEQG